ncbi:MAG: winged helix-turn-helix domain-containing protein [Nitrososphaera sp.]
MFRGGNRRPSKTKIIYRALLSYKQMKVYVSFLTEKACLFMTTTNKGEAQTFRTTEKDLRFLEIHNQLDHVI